jgi:flavin reductase (DIM6/NTAB) family NADH-FMN oxidoreductase RutF
MPVDPAEFRRIMGQFATGVTVVTTRHGDSLHGMTVNAFCSLSLQPILVVVCIDKRARSHDLIVASGAFAVSILAHDQQTLSDRFAGRHGPELDDDRFRGVAFRSEATGAPILEHTLAWLDCRLRHSTDGGDHTIFVGEVAEAGASDGEPLCFFRGQYARVAPL